MAVRRLYDGFLPGQHTIEAYGAGGFRFGGMSHRGSLLALPSGILAWQVDRVEDLEIADFAPLIAESAVLDIVLLGTGESMAYIGEELRWHFREAHLALDVMASAAAARTYNILLGEGRRVAAALIAVA